MCDLESAEHVSGSSRPLGPGIVSQGARDAPGSAPGEVRGTVAGGPVGSSEFPSSGLRWDAYMLAGSFNVLSQHWFSIAVLPSWLVRRKTKAIVGIGALRCHPQSQGHGAEGQALHNQCRCIRLELRLPDCSYRRSGRGLAGHFYIWGLATGVF